MRTETNLTDAEQQRDSDERDIAWAFVSLLKYVSDEYDRTGSEAADDALFVPVFAVPAVARCLERARGAAGVKGEVIDEYLSLCNEVREKFYSRD